MMFMKPLIKNNKSWHFSRNELFQPLCDVLKKKKSLHTKLLNRHLIKQRVKVEKTTDSYYVNKKTKTIL